MAIPFLLLSLCAFGAPDVDPVEQQRLLKIAHEAIEREVDGRPAQRFDHGSAAQAVFVTIERSGAVIGCRGDLTPRTSSLEEEVATAARSACAHDPRYRPLVGSDLKTLMVTVTIVHGQERIESVDGLSPSDGLVLVSNGRSGVVLPWEGKDPRTRLSWAYRKAGVSRGASASLFRLEAERFRG